MRREFGAISMHSTSMHACMHAHQRAHTYLRARARAHARCSVCHTHPRQNDRAWPVTNGESSSMLVQRTGAYDSHMRAHACEQLR